MNPTEKAVAREIYVGLVVQTRKQFVTIPGRDALEQMRDLAERAAAVWAGTSHEHDEFVTVAEPVPGIQEKVAGQDQPEVLYERRGRGRAATYEPVDFPEPGRSYFIRLPGGKYVPHTHGE
jgi:hypothetical protein